MPLKTENPQPRPSHVLLLHMLGTLLTHAVYFATAQMMALLARKRFGASDWETVAITAAMPTLMITSVFWGDLLRRVRLGRYLAIHGVLTAGPLAIAGFANSFWTLLVCYAIGCIGASGWTPISGELLKGFYPDAKRGRAFGMVNTAMFLGWTLIALGIGRALDINENAYRRYLPGAAAAYSVGLALLSWLIVWTGLERSRTVREREPFRLDRFVEPVVHMKQVLAEDRVFARYEAAFMTYGVGWMICHALLPVLATDKFSMDYTDFAESTQVIYPLCMLLMTYPMGRLMDRLGAARMSGLSFGWLTMYPLALLVAGSTFGVGVATAFYGTAMAAVQIAWMLGPVSLAPTTDKVGQYVAIHTTLVGLRGVLAQILGMLIYRMTGSFEWPLGVAAAAFAFASWQMWRLHWLVGASPGVRIEDRHTGETAGATP